METHLIIILHTLVVAAFLATLSATIIGNSVLQHFCFASLLVLFCHSIVLWRGGYAKSATDYTYYTLGMIGVGLFFVADETNRTMNNLDWKIASLNQQLDVANVRYKALQDTLDQFELSDLFWVSVGVSKSP